jgi:hypothetical protein
VAMTRAMWRSIQTAASTSSGSTQHDHINSCFLYYFPRKITNYITKHSYMFKNCCMCSESGSAGSVGFSTSGSGSLSFCLKSYYRKDTKIRIRAKISRIRNTECKKPNTTQCTVYLPKLRTDCSSLCDSFTLKIRGSKNLTRHNETSVNGK